MMPRSYPCEVTGLAYEGRGDYCERNVRPGDLLIMRAEPSNPYDPTAVAVYHDGRKIGYIPRNRDWVHRSISEGDTHQVVAGNIILSPDGEPVALAVEITIMADGSGPVEVPLSAPVGKAISDQFYEPTQLPPKKRSGARTGCLLPLIAVIGIVAIAVLQRGESPSTSSVHVLTSSEEAAKKKCADDAAKFWGWLFQSANFKDGKYVIVVEREWNALTFADKDKLAKLLVCGMAGPGNTIVDLEFRGNMSGKTLAVFDGIRLNPEN